jgi:hypothetical protein
MNKRDNPYTPGEGRKPRTLAGRDRDLESFHSLVERLDAGTYERSLGSPSRILRDLRISGKVQFNPIHTEPLVFAVGPCLSLRVARNSPKQPVARLEWRFSAM